MKAQTENSSKINILKTAKLLFWKYGIRRVSVEEICKETGISKMTFYRNFKNKQEVAEQVIINVIDNSQKRYRAIMDEDTTFQEKVKGIIKLEYENAAGISKELIKDIYEKKNPGLKEIFENYEQKMLKEVMKDFAKAQKNGALRKDLKLGFILYLLNDMNNKILDPELNKLYKNEEDLIMELTNFFFYGILAK